MGSEDLSVLKEINSKTMGHFDLFLLFHNICPSCLADLEISKGIRYCEKCGFCHETTSASSSYIPLGEVRSPVSSLAHGKNLGNTLQEKGVFCVLSKANGIKDLPIRAIHIRTLVRTVEHPKLMRMISLGQNLTNEWGFSDHSDPKSIMFSNYFGNALRRVGGFIACSGLPVQLTRVVRCVFALCLRDLVGEQEFQKAVEQYELQLPMLDSLHKLHVTLKEIR